MRRALLWLAFAAALGLTAYPFVLEGWFSCRTDRVISDFHRQVEQWEPISEEAPAKMESSAEPDPPQERPYPELYRDMEAYNRMLQTQQRQQVDSPTAYETPAVDVPQWLDTEVTGTISIPAMEVELPLYLGASVEHMARGAVVLGGTSCPIGGASTNCAIAAHRGYRGIPFFREVERLRVGDAVYLTNPWETLEYRVTGWAIVPPGTTEEILIQPGRDLLTLITCHPYRVGTQRYLVFCERVPEPEEPTTAERQPAEYQPKEQPTQQPTQPPTVAESSQGDIDAEAVLRVAGLALVLVAGAVLLLKR